MEVRLTKPQFQKFVDGKVKAGHFPTPEAVVEDALARMMEEDLRLTDADADAIAEADAQIDRGEVVDFDAFAAEMRREFVAGENRRSG
jgi:Arc/MetJ-type ribon-helix-helix transcriptional regulator